MKPLIIDKVRRKNYADGLMEYAVVINGIKDKKSFTTYFLGTPVSMSITLFDTKAINEILTYPYFYFISNKLLAELSFIIKNKSWDFPLEFKIPFWVEPVGIDRKCIVVNLNTDGSLWSRPYSIALYFDVLEKLVPKQKNEVFGTSRWNDQAGANLTIYFALKNRNIPLYERIQELIDRMDRLFSETVSNILVNIPVETLITYFKFSKDTRIACTQYLIYFSQFLSDVGVEVRTEIKEELNQTLFEITPIDKSESLEKIRRALEIYLKIPTVKWANLDDEIIVNTDVSSWKATIIYLQNQIQLKNIAYESLQFEYAKLEQSPKEGTVAPNNIEHLIKDVIWVDKLEFKGLTVNLAEILRKVKKMFKKM